MNESGDTFGMRFWMVFNTFFFSARSRSKTLLYDTHDIHDPCAGRNLIAQEIN